MPFGVNFALRTFGSNLSDVNAELVSEPGNVVGYSQLLFPLQEFTETSKSQLENIIANLSPYGNTPIAGTLKKVASDLSNAKGVQVVTLITDGADNGGGNVLDEIKNLRNNIPGLDVRVNIVGFGIEDAYLKEKFASWAYAGGGKYYDAHDDQQFLNAVKESILIKYIARDDDDDEFEGYIDGETIELTSGIDYKILIEGKRIKSIKPIYIDEDKTKTVLINVAYN